MTNPSLGVVFDINVWLDAFLGPDSKFPFLPSVPPTTANAAADCVSLALDGDRFRVFVSPHILKNIAKVLTHTGVSSSLIDRYLRQVVEIVLFSQGSVIDPPRKSGQFEDFEDGLIADLLLATPTSVLVTRDRQLLSLSPYHGRVFLNPTEFIKHVIPR